MQALDHRPRADLTPEEADLRSWPDVHEDLLETEDAERFRERKRAMELYVGGVSPEAVQIQTHVHQRELGDLLDRCLTMHPDGRRYGFRACIPNVRIREYTRSKELPDPKSGTGGGYAGAFRQLLNKFPEIEDALRAIYLNRANAVGMGQEVKISILSAKKRFDELCKKAGITSGQYPFNTEDGGRESLRRFFRSLHDSDYVAAINARADVDARVAVAGDGRIELGREPLSFGEVGEFDGHTVDLEIEIELWLPTPTGVEVPVLLSRLTLLVLVEEASTVIMSYLPVLRRNYNRADVLQLFARSLEPWKPMEITIPGLEYLPGAGLPSGVIPECADGLCLDVVRADNHRAHTSLVTVNALQKALKCGLNFGKHKAPLARALIELTNKLLEEKLHRVPGTTGSHPGDPRRTKQKGKPTLRLRLHEFLQLLDVVICNQNASPHRRGFGYTPLEYIRAAIDQGHTLIRTLSERERQDCSLHKFTRRCEVQGNFKAGKRPYIEYMYARYTSQKLANMPSLIGKFLTVDFRRVDARHGRAYLEDGAFLDDLVVERLWAGTQHTFEERALIAKLIRKKKLDLLAHPDPIHAAVDHMRTRASTSRVAASHFAEMSGMLGKPAGTPVPDIPPPPASLRSPEPGAPWKPNRGRWIKLTGRK